jgi:hypothetical protein
MCIADWRTDQWHPQDGWRRDIHGRAVRGSTRGLRDAQQPLRRGARRREGPLQCKETPHITGILNAGGRGDGGRSSADAVGWDSSTYVTTDWLDSILEKPPVAQLLTKSPPFYATRKFIAVLITACHLSLSWAKATHPTFWYPTPMKSNLLLLSSHLCLDLPGGFFLSFRFFYQIFVCSYMTLTYCYTTWCNVAGWPVNWKGFG